MERQWFHVAQQVIKLCQARDRKLFGQTITDGATLFKALDRDKTGEIDKHEFVGGWQKLKLGVSGQSFLQSTMRWMIRGMAC